jgi:hypothetical protein
VASTSNRKELDLGDGCLKRSLRITDRRIGRDGTIPRATLVDET